MQNLIFQYQRARLPSTLTASDSDSEIAEPCAATNYSSSQVRKFAQSLEFFEPRTELDRSLLLGLLYRNTNLVQEINKMTDRSRSDQN